ncbi:WG repeat-containing protein, partial [Aneurinibacillus sp. REN35]
ALVQTLLTQPGETVEESTGVFGYLNAKGEFAIPAQYSQGYAFSNGLAAVELDDGFAYIDKSGKVALQTA